MREVGEVTEFGGYRPGETVVIELQMGEVGEVTEFGGYRPMETGAPDAYLREVGELCEFGRQCAVQRMRIEVDRSDASRDSWEWKSYGDSTPVPYHSRGIPVEGGSSS